MRVILLVIGLLLLSGQPVRAAIECDGRQLDTLCKVYLPVVAAD